MARADQARDRRTGAVRQRHRPLHPYEPEGACPPPAPFIFDREAQAQVRARQGWDAGIAAILDDAEPDMIACEAEIAAEAEEPAVDDGQPEAVLTPTEMHDLALHGTETTED
jgi:hypothetical protein